MRWIVRAALLAAAVLAACGDEDDDAPAVGGCHLVAFGTCSEYPEGAPLGFSASGCRSAGGVWVATCPVEGRLGTCVFSVPAGPGGAPVLASETFYPGLLATPEEAADACASMQGDFTAGTAEASPPIAQAFSCDARRLEGTCTDYSGLWEPERRTAVEAACSTYGGTVLAPGVSCPTEGRTGTCHGHLGASDRVQDVRHYDPATVAADAAECGPIRWTPG